jgi:hypothetical protein
MYSEAQTTKQVICALVVGTTMSHAAIPTPLHQNPSGLAPAPRLAPGKRQQQQPARVNSVDQC